MIERLDRDAIEIAADQEKAVPQHMRALQRANTVRLARAELKRAIARGEITVDQVIRECPWEAESMTISELLTSQRRWGRTRARKFLQPLALSEGKQLGTLSERQRDLLADATAVIPAAPSPPAPSAAARRGGTPEWDELAELTRRQEDLTAELDQLTTRRDEIILSLSEAGASRRTVAEAASLTVGRVQQIVDASRAREPRSPAGGTT